MAIRDNCIIITLLYAHLDKTPRLNATCFYHWIVIVTTGVIHWTIIMSLIAIVSFNAEIAIWFKLESISK